MYTLIAGSTLAILSAWATAPTDATFNTGLARHFAEAMHQAQPACLASTVLVDSGEMLVVLDERGDVMEIDLGGLPEGASSAMMWGTSTPAVLVPPAMAAMDESKKEVDVTVEVVDGVGTVTVIRNGLFRDHNLRNPLFQARLLEAHDHVVLDPVLATDLHTEEIPLESHDSLASPIQLEQPRKGLKKEGVDRQQVEQKDGDRDDHSNGTAAGFLPAWPYHLAHLQLGLSQVGHTARTA